MSKGKKTVKKLSFVKKPFIAVKQLLVKITAPIRGNTLYKRSRKTFLRSPFRGYFKDAWSELKQVTWPDRKTSWKLTGTVIVFSVIFSVFTTLLDVGFEKIAKIIFLN